MYLLFVYIYVTLDFYKFEEFFSIWTTNDEKKIAYPIFLNNYSSDLRSVFYVIALLVTYIFWVTKYWNLT